MRPSAFASLLFVVVGLTGCGSARMVQRTQSGGILAYMGDRNEAAKDGYVKMSSHCGPGQFRVLEEGEQVVGSETHNVEETGATRRGTVVTQGGSKTTNTTEWRVTYECTGAPAQPYYGQQLAPGQYPPQQPPPGQPLPYQPGQPAGYPPPPPPGYAPPQQQYPQQPYPQQPPPPQQQPYYPPQRPAAPPPPG